MDERDRKENWRRGADGIRRYDPWGAWLQRNWKEAESRMKMALRKYLDVPRYAGEFDDIVQEFVTYSLSKPEAFAQLMERRDNQILDTLSLWCVRRGKSMRRAEDTRTALQADEELLYGVVDDDPDLNPEQILLEKEEADRRTAVVADIPKFLNARWYRLWQMYLENQPLDAIAEELNMTRTTVMATLWKVKQAIREQIGISVPKRVIRPEVQAKRTAQIKKGWDRKRRQGA